MIQATHAEPALHEAHSGWLGRAWARAATVPTMPPRPFSKEVPPRMTAAMASNSRPMAMVGWAAFMRAVMMNAATAASSPP